MRTFVLLCVGLLLRLCVTAQGYGVSTSVDKPYFCSAASVLKLYGRASNAVPNTYKGIRYNFYYYQPYSASYEVIGWCQVIWSGGSPFYTYGNIQPAYFDGSLIGGAINIPQGPTTLWMSVDLPYAAFPNNNPGQELAFDVQAVDQGGNTTSKSSRIVFNTPLLYTSPVTLSNAPIASSTTTLCTGNIQISGSPNYSSYGFTYDWYKDGAVYQLSDNTGSISVSSPGNYHAIVSDACQSATSNTLVINSGALPPAPVLSSSAGSLLCNGASTTLTASSTGGTIYWNTGATGNSITVSSAGDYYAWEVNACGQSPNSAVLSVSTGASTAAPVVSSSGGTLLCNGASVTLTASGTGQISWNTGQQDASITVHNPGNYYATASNNCGTSGNSNTLVISTGQSPAAPVISAANSTLLCNGAATTLTASGIDGMVTWNTGQTGNAISVSNAGSYYAFQTNACGTSGNSNTITISVATTPAALTISSSNGTLLCNGSNSTLSASGVTGDVTWSNGQTGSAIGISSPGNYYAYQSNSCGTSAHSNTIQITNGSTPVAPVVSSSNGTFLCNGASSVLSASPSGGGTIQWNTGQSGNTITVTAPGNYSCVEQNGCGVSASSNLVQITTGSVPAAPVVTPGNNQMLCNGATTILRASGSSVRWSTGDGGNELTVSAAGTYYAVDQNACGNSSPSNQVVITTGSCPLPTPGTSYNICPGTSKTLDAGSGFDSYSWSNGATTQSISVGPGVYSVTVTKDGCAAASGNVTVDYYAVTAPVIAASGATRFCAGGSVVLSSTSAATYLWNTGETGSSISVGTAGNFSVTTTDNHGCQATSNTITTFVQALPGASIAGSTSVCQNDPPPSVVFSGSAGSAPYVFSYQVNGGSVQTIASTEGNSVALPVPTGSAGSFTYSLVSVSESGSTGCAGSASGSATVLVNPLPTASISGTTTVCANSEAPFVVFTGSNGTAPYHFVYQVNGGAAQTIATATGNAVSLAVPTGTTGDFTYTLISVRDASSTACSNPASGSATIRVKALPSALISGTTAVCRGSAAMVHLSGSGGTAPYLFSYQVNGASTQTILSDGDGNMDIPVPTNTAGMLTYALLGVQDAGGNGCAANSGGTASITVNGLPEAVISGTTAVCQNSASPMIHFAGSGGTPPYTFVYRVNGGAPLSVSTPAGSEVDVPVPTATPGVYAFSLLSVADGSATACSNAANGSATVTVHALPDATLSGTTAVCQHTGSPDLLFTGTGGIAPYTFTYRINGGANQTITTVSGNSISVPASTDVAGSFHYTLISVQDGSSTSCVAPVSGEATIMVYALPEAAVINTSEPHLCNGAIGSIRVLNYTQGNKYQWLYNGAALRVTTGDTIMNSQSGRFTVRPVSAQGCQSAGVSNEVQITTGNVPAPVILGKTTICDSGMTKLIATNFQQPFEVWRWTDPPDSLHKGKIYGWDSSFFGHAGQYQVWVMMDGCFDSTLITISANDTEYPAGKILLDRDSIEYGGRVLITADVSGASEYHWDFGNGKQFISTDKTVAEHFYVAADSIAIKLKAVSAYNCQTDFIAFLKVLPPSPVVLKDASVSGNLKDWNLFPIPFNDHLKLSVILERSEQIRLDMFTAEGKWVRGWIKKGNRGENLFPLEGVDQLPSQVVYYVTAIYNGKKHFDTIIKY